MFLLGGVLRIVDYFVHGLCVCEVVFLGEVEGGRGRGGVDCVGHGGREGNARLSVGWRLEV